MQFFLRISLSILLLLCFIFEAKAGQLDGLKGMDVVFPTILVMGLALFVLLVLSLVRFLGKRKKPNWGITFAGIVIVLGALISLITLGSGIDPGFQITCYALIVLACAVVGLNYGVRGR